MRALQQTAQIESRPWLIFPVLIDELADRYESATALTSPEATLSYRELSERCNRYARWGMGAGLRPGDVVSLLMPNCAEYLAAWLGLTRLGASVALVNTQLRGQMLAAAIRTAGPACILVDASLAAVLEDCRSLLPARPACWVRGVHGTGFETIDAVLAGHAGVPLTDAECPPPTPDATALYIYTSGTTGLPKAARVSHRRVMQWSHWFAGLLDTRPADRMYDCLPLYHSVGGVVATGATLLGGGAVVIRPRFSVTEFWADVAAERCTLFQYIGELCRYLVNAPPRAEETRHALRVACGNGLRPEVWTSFQQRFKIPHILEYYASTEGNFSLYNCEGEPGAIGRIPPFLRHRLPVELVRFDVAAGEPLRDADGRCARCADDEVGEAIGRIPVDGTTGPGRFEGYADPVASERKILRDVFAPGDAWYRTGDLMRRDARGFYHFVDRIGDTFRWKGENVSTTEVLSVLTRIEGVLDGVVYGVPVAGAEGRAGMAALMVGPQFDLVRFRAALHRLLPGYARPPFIRLLPGIAATATHKPLKQELVLSGYDPALVRDPLYWDSPGDEAFVSIDAALFAALGTGTLRL
jgi:fatty-acyl-CoA synthase